jgi:hypothetical protein
MVLSALAAAASLVLVGSAQAQQKGAGKSSISIIKTPTPAPPALTPKAAGSVSSKPVMSVAGKDATGGASFAMKLAKDLSDPAKPGYGPGNYVLEVESSATPTGNMVSDGLAAAFFITFTIDAAGKCTIDGHPDFITGGSLCGGMSQPACVAPPALGKCSATLQQVAGNLLGIAAHANDPFGARFRIRTNPDTTNCKTGHLIIDGTGPSPATTTCRSGPVIGVGGVALGTMTP